MQTGNSHPARRLPAEILEHIFLSLAKNHNNLKTCALVCKLWRQLLRYHKCWYIHARVGSLPPEEKQAQRAAAAWTTELVNLVKSKPQICNVIQTLRLSWPLECSVRVVRQLILDVPSLRCVSFWTICDGQVMSIDGLTVERNGADVRIFAARIWMVKPLSLFRCERNSENVVSILELFNEIDMLFLDGCVPSGRGARYGVPRRFYCRSAPKVHLLRLGRHFETTRPSSSSLWFSLSLPFRVSLFHMVSNARVRIYYDVS